MHSPNQNSPGSHDDDLIEGPSLIPTDPQVTTGQSPPAPGRPVEFTQLLNAVRAAVDAARSRGRLAPAEERAVLALLEALRALVGDADSA